MGVLDYGFRVLIAPSFADIFYNNCFKNGILPITLPDAEVDELFRRAEANVGYRLTADLPNQTVSDERGLNFISISTISAKPCYSKDWTTLG